MNMIFDVHQNDFEHPGETKATFKQRFLSSLPEVFQGFTVGKEFAVLRVPSGFRRTFWEHITFWRPLELRSLPLKAHWATEVLTEHGYDWKLRWYRYAYCNAKVPAIWVRFPKASFERTAAQPASLPKLAYAGNTQLALTTAKQKTPRRTHLTLVWNRDSKT